MPVKTPLAVLWLAIAVSSVLAQSKGEEKPSTAAQDYSKEAYVIEHVSTRITAENDGSGTREVSAVIKILAEAGVKSFAVLNFTYTSANEVVDIDYVRVRKPDGTVVKTPDYNIQDMPAEVTRSAPLYSDIHEKHVAVKGLGVGDVLEYLVRYRVVKPEVAGHFWDEYSFAKSSISSDERLELNVPRDKYVKVVSPEYKPDIKDEGARRVYRWAHANLIVKEKDPDEIPRRIAPNPDVQVTTFASWEDVGRWYGGLQQEPLTVTPAIQAKAAELTKGLATDDEKIHALYNFVSLKFHYIGLDFGIGRYQPHAADDVLDNGYGDCKDKHTLLAALLKAAGIEAWPALIHAQRNLDQEVPSPAQFNHVITAVPRGPQVLWLDTTPEVAPYRLLVQPLRNKQALVVPIHDPPKLMTTPANPPQPQRQEFSMAGKLDAHGTFRGHVEQIYEGDLEVVLRSAFRRIPESQWKDAVQRFSHGLNFAGDVSEVKVTPPDELDKPLQISYEYERRNYGDWEHNQTIAPLPPMGVESSKDAKDKKPLEPVLLGALGKVSYRSRLELPAGYRAVAPPPVNLVEPYADYESRTTTEDGVMTTTRVLTIKQNEVPLSEWSGYRKFGQVIYDDEFNFWSLEGPSTTAQNHQSDKGSDDLGGVGDSLGNKDGESVAEVDHALHEGESFLRQRNYQRAQESFEWVIKKDPDHKGAHFDLGIALASRGTMADAMEEFRKEEKISPADSRPYQVLAAYLTQNGKRDEAIAEWRKLLKVDPQNRMAVASLAGMLYQSGKYSEAIAVLEPAVKASPDSPSLQLQLGSAYAKSGQSDKAVATFKQVLEQKGDDPDTLNSAAWELAENKISLDVAQQWAEKAVSRLEGQAHGAESSDDAGLRVTYELSLTWDTLGWVYFQQGDYKRAEPLVKAAWLLSEESLVGEHLGEIYAKEGKTQMAAKAYLNALAVSPAAMVSVNMSSLMMGPQNEVMKAQQKQADEIQGRYEKLTGKKPELRATSRLPNGEWTLTPAEALRRSREVKVSNDGKLSGKAQFTVVLKPGEVESAERSSGDPALEPLSDELEAAHYPIEFPPDSAAILVVHLEVTCETKGACVGRLENPVLPASQPMAPSF